MAGAVNTIGQSKRGGGDRSSRPAQLQARENEQKTLSLWIKGATDDDHHQRAARRTERVAAFAAVLAISLPARHLAAPGHACNPAHRLSEPVTPKNANTCGD